VRGGLAVIEPPAALPQPSINPPIQSSGGFKKVSFGKIAMKKEETKTAYPVMPDADGKVAEIAARTGVNVNVAPAFTANVSITRFSISFFMVCFFSISLGCSWVAAPTQ